MHTCCVCAFFNFARGHAFLKSLHNRRHSARRQSKLLSCVKRLQLVVPVLQRFLVHDRLRLKHVGKGICRFVQVFVNPPFIIVTGMCAEISSTLDVDLEPLLRDAILGLLDSKLGLVALPVSRHVHLSIVPNFCSLTCARCLSIKGCSMYVSNLAIMGKVFQIKESDACTRSPYHSKYWPEG